MAEPIDIAGSVSVVTGGASGIGKGIVKALLNNGGTVVVADIEEQPIQETLLLSNSANPNNFIL